MRYTRADLTSRKPPRSCGPSNSSMFCFVVRFGFCGFLLLLLALLFVFSFVCVCVRSSPLGGWTDKGTHFNEGGDAGNREEEINKLVRRMN